MGLEEPAPAARIARPASTTRNLVVTIGRQYGSGGREVGERLAQLLGVEYYDKKLVQRAAEESGFCTTAFEQQNEGSARGLGWLLSYASHGAVTTPGDMPLDDQLFVAQSKVIKNVALQGSCVVVGRCADYVLEDLHDRVDVVDIFVHAADEARVRRVARRNGLDEAAARARIAQIQPRRQRYYERYTGRKWGDLHNFDIVMNTVKIDDAVDAARIIVEYLVACGLAQRL
jgi:cytidylate kinase